MDERLPFEILWNSFVDFEFSSEQIAANHPSDCIYARKFSEWAGALCDEVFQHPTLVSVNQTKLLLLDVYFECRSKAPRNHCMRIGPQGHRCLYQVFVEYYERLREKELPLIKRALFEPPPLPPLPPPPPPVLIPSLAMGELEKL